MGRYRPSKATGHRIKRLCTDCYEISWVVDRYVKGSRLRFPTRYSRVSDLAGAKRFARKHDITPPEEEA